MTEAGASLEGMEPVFRAYVARVVEHAVEARARAKAALQRSQENALHRARAQVGFTRKLNQILHGDKRVA